MSARTLLLLFCLWLPAMLLVACDVGDEEDQPLFAGAATQPAPVAGKVSGGFESADCPFTIPRGHAITCGYLTVPENRSRPDSRPIHLMTAIVQAPRPGENPPIVYLAGGPGSSAIEEFLGDPEGWDYPFLQTRDLILLDQRGTGHSWPTLDCPELADADFEESNPEEACHSRLLAEGIDLTAYNSAENGADVADLRRALGYDEWDLLGISYGTRLALVVMRDHPAGVRSVVLDSPFPPNANTPLDEALNVWESLETLFADCGADAYCDQNYPDLKRLFLDTVADLNEESADDLTGDDFFHAITGALNDTVSIPLLPGVIYAVADGDYGALDLLGDEEGSQRRYQDAPDRSDSEGMYNSVICRDEYAFGTYEDAEAATLAVVPPEVEAALLQGIFELFETCAWWGAGRANPVEDAAVSSAVPTLVLTGQYDHATPSKWGRLTVETLSRAWLIDFPGTGHAVINSGDCAVGIIGRFYDSPLQPPDTRCLTQTPWPWFE